MDQELLKGNNRFAADLYRSLAGDSKGNVFFSPYGLSSVLAMLGAGARGATLAGMQTALRLPLASGALHEAFGSLAGSLRETGMKGEPQLDVANALWAQEGFALLPEFQATVRDRYGASAASLDFSDPKAAGNAINGWVAKATREKIRELVRPEELDPLTRLVVTNAVHFKSSWSSPFNPSATREEAFTLGDGSKARAALMRQAGRFPYYEDTGLQVLELPYARTQTSMIIILPRDPAGLPGIESSLDGESLVSLAAKAKPRDVDVLLPRFTITGQFRADEQLKELGMQAAFRPDADFSGVTGRPGLFISAAIHKAFLTVDESGTEAASATAVVHELSEPFGLTVFRADRPFSFLIRDNRSGSVLFLGRFTDPGVCATPAPTRAARPRRASPTPDTGPCRYCGKPGEARIDTTDPSRPTIYQCASCEAEHPGFTLHFGYLVLAMLLAAALGAVWFLWR